jgi:septal ring factor EnvC (AmiA/AmiB activator)
VTRLPALALVAVALAGPVGAGVPGSVAAATAAQKDRAAESAASQADLDDLRKRLEQLKREVASAEGNRSEAADALRESERAISDANRRLAELGRDQQAVDRSLRDLQAKGRDVEGRVREEQKLLGKLLHQQYLGGQPEPVRLTLNGDDPNRIARHLVYAGYVSRARADGIARLRKHVATLAELSGAQQARRQELASIQAAEAEARARLEADRRTRTQVLTKLSKDIERQRREIGTLERNETRLSRLVENLTRMLASRKPAPASPSGPRVRNETLPSPDTEGRAFRELKGRLALPVRGELANRFGGPREESGISWKGLFIAARGGEPVQAVAGGRVVFADWLRGFGNLLIIDHGGGYMSLYGNNDSLLRKVGESVRGGDAIAQVGASGGNPETGLYFELRHGGKPFDPLGWVRVR